MIDDTIVENKPGTYMTPDGPFVIKDSDTSEVNRKYPNPFEMLEDINKSSSAILEQKNHDYRGGSGDPYANFRGSTSLGIDPIVGILLRMQDKMMRIKTFVEKGELKVQGEGIKDAIVDITNYSALIWGLICEKSYEPYVTCPVLDDAVVQDDKVDPYPNNSHPLAWNRQDPNYGFKKAVDNEAK